MFIARPPLQRANDLFDVKGQKPTPFELDIVGIPAVGADAERTWGDTPQSQWLGPRLRAHFPKARVLLWDHLTVEERHVEADRNEHGQESDAYQDAAQRFSRMRMEDWADRFLTALEAERRKAPIGRSIVFICHSTGGLVLKEALCRKRSIALVEACLGITFFATPHHGSNVLSLAACADTIRDRLDLKWPLGSRFRDQLAPRSSYLELLNQRFSSIALGIEIWSYCEEGVLALEVRTELLPHKFRSKKKLKLSDPVVDRRSAWMTRSDNTVLVENEIMIHISANHITLPRLEDDANLQKEYLIEMAKLTTEQNARDRMAHQKLISSILEKVQIGVYEFYNETGRSMNPVHVISPRHIFLRDFLDSNFELELNWRKPSADGPNLIVTALGPSPPALSFSPTTEAFVASLPRRGRSDRLQVTDEPKSPGGLSHSRAMSRSRSRGRSVQVDGPISRIGGTPPPPVSGQYLDSILHSGTTIPAGKEAPFAWFHTPFCVSGWVPQILSIISHKKQIPHLHYNFLAKEQWLVHHNRARHAASHAQYVRPHFQSILADEPDTTVVPGLPAPLTVEHVPDKVQFALFIPFLHWDTFKMQERRSELIKRRDKQDDPRAVDTSVLESNNLEYQVLWQYLLSESPVHSRRSLDQYGYPALRNTEVRDADQVLYKKTKSHDGEPSEPRRTPRQRLASRLQFSRASKHKSQDVPKRQDRPPTVLTVDNLWLWILRHDTLVTFASKREPGSEDPAMSRQADLIASVNRAARQEKLKDCYDLAALVVNKCVTTLLEETNDPHLQIFHVFEEYLSDLTEDYTLSFKSFRNMQRMSPHESLVDDDPEDVDPMDTYASRKDLFHLFELRDITDELTTIRKLFTEQQKHVGSMRDDFRTHLSPLKKAVRALELLGEASDALEVYVEAVDTMLKSSEAMQKSYEKLLDMKTAKVNVDEAHAARKQTEVSTDQSKVVTIFTIVTIIFSPLSFMSSLFGMNVSEWSGVPTNLELWYVVRILSLGSLAVIVLALLVAFNRFTRALVRWGWEWTSWIFVGFLKMVGLAWILVAIPKAFRRLIHRFPRSALSRPRRYSSDVERKKSRATLSRESTLGAHTASSRQATNESVQPSSITSFWRRRLHQDTIDLEDDIELAKPEASVPFRKRRAGTIAGTRSAPQPENDTSTFSERTPRVSVAFNHVMYHRQARAAAKARIPTA